MFLKSNCFFKSKILIGYGNGHHCYINQVKQLLYELKMFYCTKYTHNQTHLHVILYPNKGSFDNSNKLNVQDNIKLLHLSNSNRKLCTKTLPNTSDVFGDLSYEKYEKIEMDEAEQKEEEFAENVVSLKKQRFTDKDYSHLIKLHLHKKNLQLALSVLDLIKENHDKPNLYMYRLLITAFAKQGDVEQCFKLFNNMKKRGIIPSPAIYNCLINVCAEATDTKKALEKLIYLREYFYLKKVDLNIIHYTTLIKAFSRHNQTVTAFEIADEAKDKGIYLTDIIAALFHVTISNKENGLKHTLALWHKMKICKIKPTIIHYNLLLRAIRDTKFGDLKVNDILIPKSMDTQIQLTETKRPDLLDSPPVLSTSLTLISEKKDYVFSNLDDILKRNKLILFGGIDKLLNRMKCDGVQPDGKTITLLLDLLPPTIEAEKQFLKYVVKLNVKFSITFFNMLIKRRSMRKQYKDAKDILNEIQKYHLTPNIITFGVLAVGCTYYKDGIELLEQMDNIGYAPNYVVLETLLFNACYSKDFRYVLYIMQYILHNHIKPSKSILDMLAKFDGLVLEMIENKCDKKMIDILRKRYNNFKIKYEDWKEKVKKEY